MLYNFFISFKFRRFNQSGWFLDFFLKKNVEIFVRNVFLYLGQFFAEKYMIEFLTKKIFNFCIFFFNRYLGWIKLEYVNFFLQFLIFFFYVVLFFNVVLLLV